MTSSLRIFILTLCCVAACSNPSIDTQRTDDPNYDAQMPPNDSSEPEDSMVADDAGTQSCGRVPFVAWNFDTGIPIVDRAAASPNVPLNSINGLPAPAIRNGRAIFGGDHAMGLSLENSQAIGNKIAASGEFSVEVWFESDFTMAEGPDRIFSCSFDPVNRSVSLLHLNNGFEMRVRTEVTNSNGVSYMDGEAAHLVDQGHFPTPAGKPLHVVFTYSGGKASLFVNGVVEAARAHRFADGRNAKLIWSDNNRCLVGDEYSSDDDTRRLFGTIHRIQIYDHGFNVEEARCRHEAGLSARSGL